MITTLAGLYRALDKLFSDIGPVCKECQENCRYPDCHGYLWLLPEEAKRLLETGIEVVVINRKLYFINSFSDGKGGLDIEQMKPPCPYCKGGRCSIRHLRPFVCHLYPLGFSRESGKMELILYEDCLFSERNSSNREFRAEVIVLFKQIDPKFLQRITKVYKKVLDVSIFPEGPNRVSPVMALEK